MNKILVIDGMMCMHCVAHVQKALEAVDGVETVNVSLEEKAASVNGGALADEPLIKAVEAAGYRVISIS